MRLCSIPARKEGRGRPIIPPMAMYIRGRRKQTLAMSRVFMLFSSFPLSGRGWGAAAAGAPGAGAAEMGDAP